MGYTKEEYEELINTSSIFYIKPESEPALYKKEKYKFVTYLAEYFDKFVYTGKNFRAIGEEFVDAALVSLRNFDPQKSADPLKPDFIHYFARVLKNSVKKSRAKEAAAKRRVGIVVPNEGLMIKVNRCVQYLLSKHKDPYSKECVTSIAKYARCSEPKVRECFKMIRETYIPCGTFTDEEGQEVGVFDRIDSRHYADDGLMQEENCEELLEKIEAVYNGLQNRDTQRKLFSMWITMYLIEISNSANEKFIRKLEQEDFFDKDIVDFYKKMGRPPQKGELANLCGVSLQSASRTFRMFEDKIRAVFF